MIQLLMAEQAVESTQIQNATQSNYTTNSISNIAQILCMRWIWFPKCNKLDANERCLVQKDGKKCMLTGFKSVQMNKKTARNAASKMQMRKTMAPTCCKSSDQQNTPNTYFIFGRSFLDRKKSMQFWPEIIDSFLSACWFELHPLKKENSTDRVFCLEGHHSVLPHHRSGTRHFPGTGSMQLSPTWRALQVVTDILQDMMHVCIYMYIFCVYTYIYTDIQIKFIDVLCTIYVQMIILPTQSIHNRYQSVEIAWHEAMRFQNRCSSCSF